jgi:D-alanyl-D-alanine carboxypeptidase (penicillin-binding protein 5/6)
MRGTGVNARKLARTALILLAGGIAPVVLLAPAQARSVVLTATATRSVEAGTSRVGAVAVTSTATPTPTSTAIPTSTVTPTGTVTPTSTVLPTSTILPTSTVTPTTTVTPTPGPATVAVLNLPAQLRLPGEKKTIPWPAHGQARVEVAGVGVIGRSGGNPAVPIASVTKVMTAYTVLQDHPLLSGQSGPVIRVSRAEAAAYAGYVARGESRVKVKAGERITERQALQALLLPSANNMAAILARWDAGSVPAFVRRMNANAALLGMASTHYADASGYNKASVSSTSDLLRLAPAVLADPAFAETVRLKSAGIPLNKLKNTNRLLGRHGVIGLKTGSMSASGGCLLFAAQRTLPGGGTATIYGVVLGARRTAHRGILGRAFDTSDALIVATEKALQTITLIPAGQTVATLTSADGRTHRFTVARPVTVLGWAGRSYTLSLPLGLPPGQAPSRLTATSGPTQLSIPLVPAP